MLDDLGISADGRVATFAWNTARHLELYFAAPCTGRVLHTLNIRLFPEQLTYIVNHADDEVIFVDRSLLGLLAPLLPTFERVRHLVMMDDGKGDIPADLNGHELLNYEDLLAAAEPVEFHVDDEHRAASMCYTSGTTGNPKGVVYSHRSTFLHTMGAMTADSLGARESDVILPVVPMFHANAWGLAHAAVAIRRDARDARPRPVGPVDRQPRRERAGDRRRRRADDLDGRAARAEGSRHVVAAGDPVRRVGRAEGVVGGLPRADRPADPAGVGHDRDEPDRVGVPSRRRPGAARRTTNRPTCAPRSAGSRSVSSVGSWFPTPSTRCRGTVRRAANCSAAATGSRPTYYDDPRAAESFTADGWLRTGDVATMDERGRIRLVDRTKDLIKSGGEWISSVELENELMGHPEIAEAAVVGVVHPKWGEAPLACVVRTPGSTLTEADVIAYLEGKVAKWQLPEGCGVDRRGAQDERRQVLEEDAARRVRRRS